MHFVVNLQFGPLFLECNNLVLLTFRVTAISTFRKSNENSWSGASQCNVNIPRDEFLSLFQVDNEGILIFQLVWKFKDHIATNETWGTELQIDVKFNGTKNALYP